MLEPLEDGSALLLAAAAAALVWANTPLATWHEALFNRPLAGLPFTLAALVNGPLMMLFFFRIGLEIKRERVSGHLKTTAQVLLPLVGAAGGMLVPAAIYFAFNPHGPGARGWGITVATDIAFSLAVLRLAGDRVPRGLLVFLTTLAIFDDLGGILVIALYYGAGLHLLPLLAAAAVCALLFLLDRLQVQSLFPYLGCGAALAGAFHFAGIHMTLAGVVLGLFVPAHGERSPLERFEKLLHPWSAFLIVPLFALANSAVSFRGALSGIASPVALGVSLGLFLGKPLGITAATFFAVKLGLSSLPGGATVQRLHAVATVAGIGFTVALFIGNLAFVDAGLLREAKLGILVGSIASALLGVVLLAVPESAMRRSRN